MTRRALSEQQRPDWMTHKADETTHSQKGKVMRHLGTDPIQFLHDTGSMDAFDEYDALDTLAFDVPSIDEYDLDGVPAARYTIVDFSAIFGVPEWAVDGDA